MSERTHASFAEGSFSWHYIERPALERALPLAQYTVQTKVLDLGCGAGRIINFHIQQGATPNRITGVDCDAASLAIARERFPSVNLKEGKIQSAELDGQPNIVTAILSLHYLDDSSLKDLFVKLRKAVSPIGRLVILGAHPARIALEDGSENYFNEGERQITTPWGTRESYYYRTIGSYVTTLTQSGFRIMDFDECPLDPLGYSRDKEQSREYSRSPARFLLTAQLG